MKHPRDIIATHEQKYPVSCVAWGLEAIVRMHDKQHLFHTPNEFQDECQEGCGIEDKFLRRMQELGINVMTHQYQGDMSLFKIGALDQIAKEYYPVVMLPSFVSADWEEGKFNGSAHAFMVSQDSSGELTFVTWLHYKNTWCSVPWKTMTDLNDRWLDAVPRLGMGVQDVLTAVFHRKSL